MLGKLIPYIAAAIVVLAGCTPQVRQPLEICPGKSSVAEALAALQSNSQNVIPMRAYGQCRFDYYVEGKKKPQRENFDVRLWVNPPVEIYLQGDKALVPKAILLGSNEQQFWLSIRPKEISKHWWGNWAEQDLSEGLIINPRTLLESLGIEEVDAQHDWSLSNEGPYDIIAKRQDGVVIKKIYIYSCDYRARKIEFFDRDGQAVADAELDKYKEVSDGFSIPSLIKIKTYAQETAEAPLSITLNLKSIKPATITDLRRKVLFALPKPRGFKHKYRVVNGKWYEEDQ
ncbi:MAG TPA: hypothetical protein DIU00_00150 [Phycisphaerales bacterium]|nr:hypothetical protein [Phycisphaerales bacterium]